jgi:hypothetical protein
MEKSWLSVRDSLDSRCPVWAWQSFKTKTASTKLLYAKRGDLTGDKKRSQRPIKCSIHITASRTTNVKLQTFQNISKEKIR